VSGGARKTPEEKRRGRIVIYETSTREVISLGWGGGPLYSGGDGGDEPARKAAPSAVIRLPGDDAANA